MRMGLLGMCKGQAAIGCVMLAALIVAVSFFASAGVSLVCWARGSPRCAAYFAGLAGFLAADTAITFGAARLAV